jgi:hypothetical protein
MVQRLRCRVPVRGDVDRILVVIVFFYITAGIRTLALCAGEGEPSGIRTHAC